AEIDLERLKNVRKPLPLEDLAAGLVGVSPEAFSDFPSLFDSKPVLAALAGILAGEQPRELEEDSSFNPAERASIRERLNFGPDEKVACIPVREHSLDVKSGLIQFLLGMAGDNIRESVMTGEPLPESTVKTLSPARVRQLENAVKDIRGE